MASKKMKNLRPASWLSAGLVVGLIAGSSVTSVFWTRWVAADMTSTEFVAVGDTLVVLKALREGDTNAAINRLETQLDEHLVPFGAMILEVPAEKRRPDHGRLITRVRDYRVAFPRKTDSPDQDRIVERMLLLTNAVNAKP